MKLFITDDEIDDINGKKYLNLLDQKLNGLRKSLTFLNYPNGKSSLLKFYEDNPKFILPETRKNEVISFVKMVLKIYL